MLATSGAAANAASGVQDPYVFAQVDTSAAKRDTVMAPPDTAMKAPVTPAPAAAPAVAPVAQTPPPAAAPPPATPAPAAAAPAAAVGAEREDLLRRHRDAVVRQLHAHRLLPDDRLRVHAEDLRWRRVRIRVRELQLQPVHAQLRLAVCSVAYRVGQGALRSRRIPEHELRDLPREWLVGSANGCPRLLLGGGAVKPISPRTSAYAEGAVRRDAE